MKQTCTNSRVIIYFVYLFYQKEKNIFSLLFVTLQIYKARVCRQ